MNVSELEILELLHRLPDDAALLTEEAAVFIRLSPRTLERWRSPVSGVQGPRYQQSGGMVAKEKNEANRVKGANQKITYLIRDLKAWQESITVSDNIEAAVRKGQCFMTTLADIVEERAFWRTHDGMIAGLVDETSVDIFFERLGLWEIEWMPVTDALNEQWESIPSHGVLAKSVSDILKNGIARVAAGVEKNELGGYLKKQPQNPTGQTL